MSCLVLVIVHCRAVEENVCGHVMFTENERKLYVGSGLRARFLAILVLIKTKVKQKSNVAERHRRSRKDRRIYKFTQETYRLNHKELMQIKILVRSD